MLSEIDIIPARRLPLETLSSFVGQTSCVGFHYLEKLRPLNLGKVAKIFIELVSKEEPEEFHFALDVLRGYVPFDFERFSKLKTKFDRKAQLAETLHRTLIGLSADYGWDSQPFSDAYEAVKREGYRCIVSVFGQPKWNRRKTLKATVRYEYDLDEICAEAVIESATHSAVESHMLFRMTPNAYLASSLLHKGAWANDRIFQITSMPSPLELEASGAILLEATAATNAFQDSADPLVTHEVLHNGSSERSIHVWSVIASEKVDQADAP